MLITPQHCKALQETTALLHTTSETRIPCHTLYHCIALHSAANAGLSVPKGTAAPNCLSCSVGRPGKSIIATSPSTSWAGSTAPRVSLRARIHCTMLGITAHHAKSLHTALAVLLTGTVRQPGSPVNQPLVNYSRTCKGISSGARMCMKTCTSDRIFTSTWQRGRDSR